MHALKNVLLRLLGELYLVRSGPGNQNGRYGIGVKDKAVCVDSSDRLNAARVWV